MRNLCFKTYRRRKYNARKRFEEGVRTYLHHRW